MFEDDVTCDSCGKEASPEANAPNFMTFTLDDAHCVDLCNDCAARTIGAMGLATEPTMEILRTLAGLPEEAESQPSQPVAVEPMINSGWNFTVPDIASMAMLVQRAGTDGVG